MRRVQSAPRPARALIEQLARGETPEKLSYMPEALFTADTLTAELLESRVY